jgi:MFS family permease
MSDGRAAARDRRLLCAAAFVRALASGMVGVVIGLHLAARGFDPAETGLVISTGLAGAAVAALIVTAAGDRLGRRRTLLVLGALGAAGGVVLAIAPVGAHGVVLAAAFAGMLNGMGKDRGAAQILDQALLPTTVGDRDRTRAFAWYGALQDAGHALGGLAAGAPVLLRRATALDEATSLEIAMLAYAGLCAATAALYAGLSATRGASAGLPRTPIAPHTRQVLWRIGALFGVDSLAGGFLTTAMVSLFLFERWGVDELTVGVLYFAARVLNAGSHLGAAWLARRIGLVNTMVFTHIPSSLLLVTVAVAPSFPIAAALFLAREGLVEMDVPTRQSYVMAVVAPEDRTVAAGVTFLIRLVAWSIAPVIAGGLMRGSALAYPLFIGAAMKIAYDLLLYVAFRRRPAPEERAALAGADRSRLVRPH